MTNLIYAGLVLLAGSLYGFGSPILKLAYEHGFSVNDVTNAQYGFAGLVMWIIALFWHKGKRIAMSQWPLLALLGFAGAATSFFYYEALTKLPASLGIVLLFQFAWMVVVIDIIVRRKWPGIEKWAGLILILVGTVLAVDLISEPLTGYPLWALVSGLAAGASYSVLLYFSAYSDAETSPTARSSITLTISMVLIMIPFHPTYLYTGVLGKGLWFWGLLMAIFCQIGPMLLMLVGVPRIGGRMAGVLGSIELPISVILSRIILGEHVTISRWVGVCFIITGIVISEFFVRNSHGGEHKEAPIQSPKQS